MIADLKIGDKVVVSAMDVAEHTFKTIKHNAAGKPAGFKTGYFGQMKVVVPNKDGVMTRYQCSIQLVEVDIYKPRA